MKKGIILMACFALVLAASAAWAAGLADLAKIQIKVTTEKEVRALLGEPKKVDSFSKQQRSGRDFKERMDLIYELDGKEVIIRIDPKTGLVVKVVEL